MEQTSVWIIGIIALAIGGLIGYLLGRSGSDAGERQTLNRQLEEARQELDNYKQEVTDHFEKTAELVNQLTSAYRDVHQHLAQGAQTLGADESATLLKEDMQPRLEAAEEPEAVKAVEEEEASIPVMTDVVPSAEPEQAPEPPRDYATKAANEEGTLSERYGLEKTKESEDEQVRDPSDLAAMKHKQQEKEQEKEKAQAAG